MTPRLGASLEQFTGRLAHGIQQLHDDLERFSFLPGGSGGEPRSARPAST